MKISPWMWSGLFFCGDDLRWVPAPFPQKESNGSYHYWWRIKRNKQTSKLLVEFISAVFRLQNLSTACKLRCEAETREGKISKAEQEWEEACFFFGNIFLYSPHEIHKQHLMTFLHPIAKGYQWFISGGGGENMPLLQSMWAKTALPNLDILSWNPCCPN